MTYGLIILDKIGKKGQSGEYLNCGSKELKDNKIKEIAFGTKLDDP